MTTDQRPVIEGSWPRRPVPAHTATWIRQLDNLRDLAGARAYLRGHLRARGVTEDGTTTGQLSEAAERVLLAADEMTSNGVRHGHPPVGLTLAYTGTPHTCLLIVADQAPAHVPTPDPDRDPSHGGLGLLIIASYATDHGWWTTATVKNVWALLPLA